MMKLVTSIVPLIFAFALIAPAANATSVEDTKKIVDLFTNKSISAERSVIAEDKDAHYKVMHISFESGGQKYSAQLIRNGEVRLVVVEIPEQGYTTNVNDIDGDGIVDEVSESDSDEPYDPDEKTRAELSAKYRKTIDAMLAYYKANKK